MKRSLVLSAFALAAFGFSAHAQAQTRGWLDNTQAYSAPDQQSYYDARRTAYDNGFREGVKQGEKDAQKNRSFAYQDEKTFQRADKGYHREFGALERYRQTFRNGYAAGYSDGYQRYRPAYGNGGYGNPGYGNPGYGNGRYGQGRAIPRDDRGVWGGTAGGYPQSYPQYPGTYGGYGSYRDIASQNGFNDGLEKGAEDARKNRSFDPLRHEWYRSGDRHYESRYGNREQYKDFYREAFKAGYERGYRDGRYR
jgi:flagellar biosynthesis/type III secretory pathway protein FliH